MKARNIQRILYVVLIIACIVLCAYEIIDEQALSSKNLVRSVLIIIGCVLGIVRGERGRGRKSLNIYEKSYQKEIRNAFIDDKNDRKQLLRALRFYDENKHRKALKLLFELKEKCKRSEEYYAVGLFTALCYEDMQLFAQAIHVYEQLISQCLESETIYNNLGHIYCTIGKRNEAISCYEKALVIAPKYEFAYVNIANLHFQGGDMEAAIPYAKEALEINSKQIAAANLLAIVYALKEDKENADKYFHIAIASGGNPKQLRNAIDYYKTRT